MGKLPDWVQGPHETEVVEPVEPTTKYVLGNHDQEDDVEK